ncbi:response regulator transcription factor [Streptomyces sp. NPDC014892]|uniref:response regulator transcription factor n=1 Tax=Streptomyces TaxID=1883 RepID=UPI001EFBA610|nr:MULTISPECIES: response regulator [Streptomyces]MEE1763339.1 response regulator [Streptomyces sp. SP18BB07]MEE1831887.1 response regulator [Streptomyces sp. SP17KL33]ULR49117.1 response regulator [Streptomyces deccanensis]
MSRILVVEDEPHIATLVVKALRRDGHDVVLSEDGEVGLFIAEADGVDCVVLDLGLPGLPGGAMLGMLREDHQELPVVVLTGYDDPEHRAECLAAGANVFLTKPFTVTALRGAVREQLAVAGAAAAWGCR